eukprot:m51a1_g126 hypothetical protein (515) ;mRNA; r:424621-426989
MDRAERFSRACSFFSESYNFKLLPQIFWTVATFLVFFLPLFVIYGPRTSALFNGLFVLMVLLVLWAFSLVWVCRFQNPPTGALLGGASDAAKYVGVCLLAGSFMSYFISYAVESSLTSGRCTGGRSCAAGSTFAVICCGAINGATFALMFLHSRRHVLRFPDIVQNRWARMYGGAAIAVNATAWGVAYSMAAFLLLRESRVMNRTCSMLVLGRCAHTAGSFLLVYLQALVTSIVLHATWNVSALFWEAILTEKLSFFHDNEELLPPMLEFPTTRKQTVKYLAFQDLWFVSTQASTTRRSLIYGGVPQLKEPPSWPAVQRACTRILLNATQAITPDPLQADMAQQAQPMPRGPKEIALFLLRKVALFVRLIISGQGDRVVAALTPQFMQKRKPSPFSLAFCDFQLQVWSIQSLAALVARSRTEDRYGTLQLSNSLESTLMTFLDCLEAIDQRVESCGAAQAYQRRVLIDGHLFELRHHLEQAVYEIIREFYMCVSQFKVPERHAARLRSFCQFAA